MVTVDASHLSSFRKWDEGRPAPSQNQIVNCPVAQVRSSPPSTVARALRENCNIPFESFFLATHLGNGKFAYFSGPRPISEDDIRAIFKRDKFLQFQNRPSSSGSAPQTYEDDYADGSYSDHTTVTSHGQWRESRSRKRARRQGAQRRGLDDDAPPIIVSPKKALEIGNSDAVWEFYDRGFKCIQQTACKEIGKAFIKLIAPKKQANNPYTKGDATAPDWWPRPWGPGQKDKVRHVEPDHLWKKERVHLLKHILRLIIDPKTQPSSMQKLEGLTVAKLEIAAIESLAVWFGDKKKPENAMKKPILKEIFKVAKMEERYRRDEIDATTQVFVTADDMIMGYCCDEDAQADDEEEARAMAAESARADLATSGASPTRAAAMLPAVSPTGNHVHDLSAQFHSASFLSSQYSPPAMLPSSLSPDQYPYPDGQSPLQPTTTTLQLHDMLASSHDTGRRASLFTPTSDFSSSPYHAAAWSQSPPPAPHGTPTTTSAAASPEASSPLFTYAPHHHHYHPQQQQQPQTVLPPPPALPLPMPMPQHHHHPHSQSPYVYDTALTHHHQQQQQVEFRGGSINLSFRPHQQQHQQQQQQGYGGYLSSHSHHHHHHHQEAVGGSPVSRN